MGRCVNLITFENNWSRLKKKNKLSHLKNSIDRKMVRSVTIVVSVNSSTCHHALKFVWSCLWLNQYDGLWSLVMPMIIVMIMICYQALKVDSEVICDDKEATQNTQILRCEFKNEFWDDVDQSLSENVVNLAKTRERCSVLVSSICLMGDQLIIGDDDIKIWWFLSTVQIGLSNENNYQHTISKKRRQNMKLPLWMYQPRPLESSPIDQSGTGLPAEENISIRWWKCCISVKSKTVPKETLVDSWSRRVKQKWYLSTWLFS